MIISHVRLYYAINQPQLYFITGLHMAYVSIYFASHLRVSPEPLSVPLRVLNSVGDFVVVDWVCRYFILTIQGEDIWVDLLSQDMLDFDTTLGMD